MRPINWHHATRILAATCLLVVSSCLLAPAVEAQFGSPPGQGKPKGGTAGGGSRPTHLGCLQQSDSQEALLAMAPIADVGLTPRQQPTIWVYVPKTTAKTLEFSLFTQAQEGVYQVNLPVAQAGLLKITLPTEAALATGKPYYWVAALVCDPQRRAKDWHVGGWIQQQPLSPELQRQLARATRPQQIALYAQSGFWYEAFTTYVGLAQTEPKTAELKAIAANLLQLAGRSAIVPQINLVSVGEHVQPPQASH